MLHCRQRRTQVSQPAQNQSQSKPEQTDFSKSTYTTYLRQSPLTHQIQTVNLSRQRQIQSQKQTQVTGRGISDEHEKRNKKNRSIPQSEDESTNGISFN